jgi:hypothetical protein
MQILRARTVSESEADEIRQCNRIAERPASGELNSHANPRPAITSRLRACAVHHQPAYYDQCEQAWRETTFNDYTIARETVTLPQLRATSQKAQLPPFVSSIWAPRPRVGCRVFKR